LKKEHSILVIEGQTHFGMPKGAEMSMVNEPK
jgi:hypothetical protein